MSPVLPRADLAFLKIDAPQPLPFINLTDLSPNLLGETVLVLGNPLGYGSSVARGILSAKNRTVTVEEVDYRNLDPDRRGHQSREQRRPGRRYQRQAHRHQLGENGLHPAGCAHAGPRLRHSRRGRRDQMVEEFKKVAIAKAENRSRNRSSKAWPGKFFGLQLQDLTPQLSETFRLRRPAPVSSSPTSMPARPPTGPA